jgi:sporulation protein YlmC with PRC-barrel domain
VSKTTMTAVLVAMLAVSMPVYAQTMNKEPAAPAARSAATHQLQPGQIRASEMIGSSVYDTQSRDIGKIKDVVLDRQGKVDLVVLDVGAFLGMGGKYVAVPMRDLKTANDNGKVRWTTDMTKEQLQQAQAFNLGPTTSAGTSMPPSSSSTTTPPRSTTAPSTPPRQ